MQMLICIRLFCIRIPFAYFAKLRNQQFGLHFLALAQFAVFYSSSVSLPP
jgi:hypothetical protein